MFVSHNQIVLTRKKLSKLKENDIPWIDKSKFFLLTSPRNSQDLSFSTRDGTKAIAVKAGTLTTGLPENSWQVENLTPTSVIPAEWIDSSGKLYQ